MQNYAFDQSDLFHSLRATSRFLVDTSRTSMYFTCRYC